MLTRKPFRLVSTTAKLKTKKLVGFGANEVKHVIQYENTRKTLPVLAYQSLLYKIIKLSLFKL